MAAAEDSRRALCTTRSAGSDSECEVEGVGWVLQSTPVSDGPIASKMLRTQRAWSVLGAAGRKWRVRRKGRE